MPAGFLGGDFDIAQHGADVNHLAVVATVIFAELLHAENQGISKMKYSPGESFSTALQISAKCFSSVGR